MQQPAVDGKAHIVEIEIGQIAAHPLTVEQHRVVALIDHRVAPAREGVALPVGVEEVDEPALAVHHVVVQLLLQPLPELERMGIELRIAFEEVVGPDDRRVAPDVAAAQIALFQHRDIGQPVFAGKVIGGGQPVAAAADDDGVILGLGFGIAPMGRPALVACQPLAQNAQTGKPHLMPSSSPRPGKASFPVQRYQCGTAQTGRFPTGFVVSALFSLAGAGPCRPRAHRLREAADASGGDLNHLEGGGGAPTAPPAPVRAPWRGSWPRPCRSRRGRRRCADHRHRPARARHRPWRYRRCAWCHRAPSAPAPAPPRHAGIFP